MKIVSGTLLVLTLSLAASETSGEPSRQSPAKRDSYVLVRGNSSSINGSIEELEALRDVYAGDFLWARRSGAAYVIRDTRLVDQAAALFDTVRQLEPEQADVQRRQELLDREEGSLDREQERLDSEADRRSEQEPDEPAGNGPYPDLEADQRALEARQVDLARRQREIEALEQDLDRREEALEKEAEAALWKLIDRAIREGSAAPASR
jgi:DNA repair exonuclease SbcCD ATPase subunit